MTKRTEIYEGDDALVAHLQHHGYEGIEHSVEFLRKFYPSNSDAIVARLFRQTIERAGLEVFGAVYIVREPLLRTQTTTQWWHDQDEQIKYAAEMGAKLSDRDELRFARPPGGHRHRKAAVEVRTVLLGMRRWGEENDNRNPHDHPSNLAETHCILLASSTRSTRTVTT